MHEILHSNVHGYLNMLADDPFHIDSPKMTQVYQKFQNNLYYMQNTLLKVQKDDKLYPVMESYFVKHLYEIIKGTEFNEVFNEEGVVNFDFKGYGRIL